MYIKQIVIVGFKSYGHRTVVEPFHPGHNVIVGKNGSGKSNFFTAIQFVLSNEFSRLQDKQRQSLLHEGSGPKVISGSVELIFDNKDRRLPIEKDDVSLKRVIGLKTDEYFINNKKIDRKEVSNILESAGFSSSNPYFIVQQGQISQMTMTSESRLMLLREIAGTNVYENKRNESLLILNDTQMKIDKINDLLNSIDERLETLKDEMEEYKEYQILDKQQRSIQHEIYDRIRKENNEKLQELEKEHNCYQLKLTSLNHKLEDKKQTIKDTNKELKKIKKEIEQCEEIKKTLNTEQEAMLKNKTKLMFQLKDLTEEVASDEECYNNLNRELKSLELLIESKQAELEKIQEEYTQYLTKEQEINKELEMQEQKRDEIYKKQGRIEQYASKEERDSSIVKELDDLKVVIDKKESHILSLQQEIEKDEEISVSLENSISETKSKMDYYKSEISESNNKLYDLNQKKRKYFDEKRDLFQREKYLEDKLNEFSANLNNIEYSFKSLLGRSIINGKTSIDKVLETFSNTPEFAHKVSMYQGLLIENFTCDPRVYKAVEVTAGSRLFYHIVENREFGKDLIKEINRQKLPGEITFLPLDSLKAPEVSYPETAEATPLIEELVYVQKNHIAMNFVFGRKLLCSSLDVGTQLVKENRNKRLDCVTVYGDQVVSQGWLKGGHHSSKRSLMQLQQEKFQILKEKDSQLKELQDISNKIKEINGKIDAFFSELQRTETKISRSRDIYSKLESELNINKSQLHSVNVNKANKAKYLQKNKLMLEKLRAQESILNDNLKQDFVCQLSSDDELQLQNLNNSITKLSKDHKKLFESRVKLENEKNKLENLLEINLLRQKDQLSQKLQRNTIENTDRNLESHQAQLDETDERLSEIEAKLIKKKEKMDILEEQYKSKTAVLDEMKLTESQLVKERDEGSKNLDTCIEKINGVREAIATTIQKTSELGAIPSSQMSAKYKKMKKKLLFENLKNIKNELQNYKNVNKKALDQFNAFREEKVRLHERKREVDQAYEKIKELMEILQQKKYETIDLTFKQVSKYFSDIFKKLVPMGHAQLVMKSRRTAESSDDSSINADDFIGIDIKVSFNGRSEESREMNLLSGGQKSLIALVLIFAIQKCDPAPFYLFDEIDQALDAEHRRAVADLIHEQSNKAQFITITFRPEFLLQADKYYGVRFNNKASFVESITREKAAEFIESDNN